MSKRTLIAALVLVGALAALLVAWFSSGWADVRARQSIVREAPAVAANQRGAELARELRDELAAVMAREIAHPYYHYQNVFHDPLSSASVGVSPSPLARGPDDPLVLGHFRIDEDGRVTTPTINDDVPSLSEPMHLAGNTAFRNEVARTLAGPLTPHGTEVLVASAKSTPPPRQPRAQAAMQQEAQVVRIDNNSFTQNNAPNMVYQQQAAANGQDNGDDSAAQQRQTRANPPVQQRATLPVQQRANPPVQQRANPQTMTNPSTGNPVVAVVVSAFEWKTLPFRGGQSLIAVQTVQMPERALAQGFVIDRSTMTSWLASRAGDSVAELRHDAAKDRPGAIAGETKPGSAATDTKPGSAATATTPASAATDTQPDDGATAIAASPSATNLAATEIAPGWHLAVSPNPHALVAANDSASQIARAFVIRFVVVGVVAALAALFVVFLVARAEALARERSQFAAAAAHELRTPLAGLQLYGDMLADGLGDPAKMRDYARRMSEEASRLGRVVSNVLGFSQLERGNLSVEPRVGPLGEALRELADRARPALDRAGATLSLEVADVEARFDRDALARIVANLLDNAEKYSRGADDRTIGLVASEASDGIEVAVADRGPGIDPRGRASLFRAFKRGVDADGPAGLGLGLALSQSLARAMDGELAYRPTPEGGATFVLRLAKA